MRCENDSCACPFCSYLCSEAPFVETGRFYAKPDSFPVSRGHTLIIPKRHVITFFELDDAERLEFFCILLEVRQRIDRMFGPDGYNIGVNVGSAAGQTIEHVHIHVIPRYTGDVGNPEGGVRAVIPGKGPYRESMTLSDVGE